MFVATSITQEVEVTVETLYQSEYSNPEMEHFRYAYRITIKNMSAHDIQLTHRYWHIFDAKGDHKLIDAIGVVGQQPIITAGQSHQYVSGCNLKSPYGYMVGHYEMLRLYNHETFRVSIPQFNLIADYKLN
ncbi:Co2+/Mg2+ efflux protein ApaG [Sphingobacteriaceae bacterium WQ 2009]|uniref:Co2+/Mg2+ efflux protein ApaG n=1 Tax=Rhinopithecimicrobium faecis TaxID=2820698 RepID=A0A8T4HAR5_9SPHI|nr:Co2+/Mg2+ efflux protein ApaG [Sphingobacteriaceae bacterium WQ 2009]